MNNNKQNKSLTNNAKKIANKTLNATKDLAAKAQTTLGNAATKIKNTANKVSENVKQKISNTGNKTNLKEPLTKWSSMTQDFFNSNTAISKFVGFFLCLLLFVIIFQIGMSLINRFIAPSESPYIINGMIESDKPQIISVNPGEKNSIPIYRSNNQPQGIEYSWNVWFVVDNEVSIPTNSRIFSKSPEITNTYNNNYMTGGITKKFANSSPGLFLTKTYEPYTTDEDTDQDTLYDELNKTDDTSISQQLTNIGTSITAAVSSYNDKKTATTMTLKQFNDLKLLLTNSATTSKGILEKITDAQKSVSDLFVKIQSSSLYTIVNTIFLKLNDIKTNINTCITDMTSVKFTTTAVDNNLTSSELIASKSKIVSVNTLISNIRMTNAENALEYAINAAYQNKEDITTASPNLNRPIQYSLTLVMNTFDNTTTSKDIYEKIIIDNIPIQKWVCCTIRVQGLAVDVYINGMLKKRQNLNNVPKQNYYDIYIGEANGFKGYISSLKYYNYAINYNEVQSLFLAGPSLKMISNDMPSNKNDYLSVNWYFK